MAASMTGFLSPLNRRRWRNFKAIKRGYVSLLIFTVLFIVSLFAELIANDKPILVSYEGAFYMPILEQYPETTFGGEFESEADYRDPFLVDLIEDKGWMLWPPVPFSYDTINYDLETPAPSPPSADNWLGTDDQGRDVLARLIYGFRISVLFGLFLTLSSSVLGIAAGALQGYFGGLTDLLFQRFIEIWSGLPVLFLLIILASFIEPGFWSLLIIMLLFSWMALEGVVRAEFLRARNFEYVRAARALGVATPVIILRHLLPNAMVATLTFLPFILSGSITTLTALDFLGFGLPPGSPSLGEMLAQGKANLQAPWLGVTAFCVLAFMLSLLVFIGEAARDAFDPRRTGLAEKESKISTPSDHDQESEGKDTGSEAHPADMPLVSVSDLKVVFTPPGGAVVEAVRGVSFDIRSGEAVALVGESGSGKSVTALSIMQLLPYPRARHPSGRIRFEGREILGASSDEMHQVRGDRISMIFQEPMTSLNPLHHVEKQIGETLILHRGLEGEALRCRILELLDMVGLGDGDRFLRSYPHELSGGQRQRVMIAMALANEPDLLIADEPTTALDVTIQVQILDLLKTLQSRLGMALLLITHDLAVVRKMARRVYVMRNGVIVEHGERETVLSNPHHPYTRHLLASEPKPSLPRPVDSVAPLLEARNLKVWHPVKRGLLRRNHGYVKAVDGVDFTLHPGRSLGIVGESGCGKTSLALALLRLGPGHGLIHFDGQSIDELQPKELRPLRRKMQIVFQDPFASLNPRLSIKEIIGEGLAVHHLAESEKVLDALIDQVLGDVGLSPGDGDRYPHEFSGGQRQRVAIARALVLRPKFLILDEPTSALDVSVQAQIVDLLRELQEKYDLAYLFISHDLKVVRALADDILVMQAGRVVERGPTARIFDAPQQTYTRTLIDAAFRIENSPDHAMR